MNYRNILIFLEEEKACLEWNPVTETGNIFIEDMALSFKVDVPFLIGGYAQKLAANRIIRREGDLLIHPATEKTIQNFFAEEREKRKLLKNIAVIIIDPGHGGKDPGAIRTYSTKSGTVHVREKDVVLDVGIRLEKLLKRRYPGKRIVMTRSDDRFPTLEERVKIANTVKIHKNDAILFISVHANASLNSKSSGFEVWHLPPTYRRTVIDSKSIEPEEKEILPILNNMLEEEYLIESIKLATSILNHLDNEVGTLSENRGIKAETWFVVRKANMPSVLVETGFVSNRQEALRLKEESYLNKLSKGIYNGITEFIATFENTKGFTE